jgi:hypothetical protein
MIFKDKKLLSMQVSPLRVDSPQSSPAICCNALLGGVLFVALFGPTRD